MTAGVLLFAAMPASAGSNYENDFASRHNSIRASNGRRSLAVYGDLADVARRQAARMAAAGDIWHNPNLTSEVKNWRVVGENVGMGPSVPDLMDAFMNSPGHRSNILDTDYNQFGVGVSLSSDGTIFVAVVFAQRSTSTSTSTSKPATKPKVTTSKPAASRRATTTRPAAPSPSTAKPAAAAPVTPVAVPAPPVRTVDMLERMLQLDS